jgi:hypothetical protein
MVRAFALATGVLALGCGSSNKHKGDGGTDAGNGKGDAASGDAGAGADASVDGGALSCGSDSGVSSCESVSLAGGAFTLAACCTSGDKCGLDMDTVGAATNGLFSGCVERHQPTVPAIKAVSNFCTSFWESVSASSGDGGLGGMSDGGLSLSDGGTAGDGGAGFSVDVLNMHLTFAGCCRLNAQGHGECGFSANRVLGADVDFGCLPIESFKKLFPSNAAFQQVKAQAVCDPTTGEQVGDAGVGGDGGTADGG